MRIVELDGSDWKSPLDFYQALFQGIEQGYPHGMNINAFINSMIWRGMGGIEPPYMIRVINLTGTPEAVRDEVSLMIEVLRQARQERSERQGVDVEVSISAPDLAH